MGKSGTEEQIDEEDLTTIVRIQLLLNAKLYDGKPNIKAVLGKILGKNPDLRKHAKTINAIANELKSEIESLTLDQISGELSKLAPEEENEYHQRKQDRSQQRKEQKKELPELQNAIQGKVIVRYAPDPSKYPHLGQGMNYLVNRMYADKYGGTVVLRFDDTNPTIVKPEYYDAIKDGLMWLGCTWDKEIKASDFVEEFYEVTKNLIIDSHMYVCQCSSEELSTHRNEGISCIHREHTGEENQRLFNEMTEGKFKPGEAIVRLRGDMNSRNNVMRDPVMLRVVSDQHPLLDKFYHVFPTYDFESAHLENKEKITHVIRSGEFGTMRQELQSYIIEILGGTVPEFVQFGRFNFQGSPTKGRVIRELVETNVVKGWDDIRLLTLLGLKKRGLHPQTARSLIQEAGLSPKTSTLAWSILESKSKELLEPEAKRYFFVEDPIKLTVEGGPDLEIELDYHPDHPNFGKRKFMISSEFHIAGKDGSRLKTGSIFRLKDCYNVQVSKINGSTIIGKYKGEELLPNTQKIQWVPADYVQGTLDVPYPLQNTKKEINEDSMKQMNGYFESSIQNVNPEDVIQLERVGYAKIKLDKTDGVSGHIIHLH